MILLIVAIVAIAAVIAAAVVIGKWVLPRLDGSSEPVAPFKTGRSRPRHAAPETGQDEETQRFWQDMDRPRGIARDPANSHHEDPGPGLLPAPVLAAAPAEQPPIAGRPVIWETPAPAPQLAVTLHATATVIAAARIALAAYAQATAARREAASVREHADTLQAQMDRLRWPDLAEASYPDWHTGAFQAIDASLAAGAGAQ